MINQQKQKNNLQQIISHEIEQVSPIPKWRILLQKSLVWIFGIFSFVLGSLATASIIFILTHSGSDLSKFTHASKINHLSETIPSLWFITLIVFTIITHKLIRSTNTGYRYNLLNILLILILTSTMGGIILNALGAGRIADERTERLVPFYISHEKRQKRLWVNPEDGRIAGSIVQFETSSDVFLEDFQGNKWVLDISENPDYFLIKINTHPEVRIFGTAGEESFYVCEMHPWIIEKTLTREQRDILKQEDERNLHKERSTKCKELQESLPFRRPPQKINHR